MTAPDVNADVRARFEVSAWQRRIKPDSGKWLAWEYFAGAVDYDNDRARFPDRVGRWECEYRPLYAHADLSGEVRELVEAARNVADERHTHSALGSKDGGESCGICGKNWRSGVHLRAGESEQADKLRLKAALAKFHPTHQEKP